MSRRPVESSDGYWRREARPIVAAVLERFDDPQSRDCRRALREAYPFGPREHWPYKVWLDEIAVQTGRRTWGVAARRRRRPDLSPPETEPTPLLPFGDSPCETLPDS